MKSLTLWLKRQSLKGQQVKEKQKDNSQESEHNLFAIQKRILLLLP